MPTSRTSKTAKELEAALNKALQAHPECEGMSVAKLRRLDHPLGHANWDAEFAGKPGVTMSPDCTRVMLNAKHGVQKHYDLAGEG